MISAYDSDFHGWDGFSDEGVCKGHLRRKKARV